MMNEERIAEIRARLQAATPGPWYARATDDQLFMNARYVSTQYPISLFGDGFTHDHTRGMDTGSDDHDESHVVAITLLQSPRLADHASELWDENTLLIANAPTDIADLLDALEAMRAASQKLVDEINHHCREFNGFNVREAITNLEKLL